jgi:hypothetical protein
MSTTNINQPSATNATSSVASKGEYRLRQAAASNLVLTLQQVPPREMDPLLPLALKSLGRVKVDGCRERSTLCWVSHSFHRVGEKLMRWMKLVAVHLKLGMGAVLTMDLVGVRTLDTLDRMSVGLMI